MTEAERRAFNRGLETAAKLAALYADENWRMNHDTLLADPILMGTATAATIKQDVKKSEDLLVDGHGHAMAAHACQNLAKMIRNEKMDRKS